MTPGYITTETRVKGQLYYVIWSQPHTNAFSIHSFILYLPYNYTKFYNARLEQKEKVKEKVNGERKKPRGL